MVTWTSSLIIFSSVTDSNARRIHLQSRQIGGGRQGSLPTTENDETLHAFTEQRDDWAAFTMRLTLIAADLSNDHCQGLWKRTTPPTLTVNLRFLRGTGRDTLLSGF
jgi:hypothetical protein